MNHFMGKFLQSLILRQFEVEWDTWATIQGIVAPGSRDEYMTLRATFLFKTMWLAKTTRLKDPRPIVSLLSL